MVWRSGSAFGPRRRKIFGGIIVKCVFCCRAARFHGVNRNQDICVNNDIWLDVDALLKDDMAKVLAILQQGLASSEHGDFVVRLSKEKR
jgi:hypothetical protein